MSNESTSTDLIVIPHPLTLEGRTITRAAELRPGDTLAMFLQRQGVDLADAGWSVTVGGAGVPALMWGRTRPAHGQVIEVRRVAGKSALRLIAMIALAYVTLQLGLPGAYFGLQGFAAYAVNVAAFVLGSMVINRLLPPPQLKGGAYNNSTGTTYSLQGARNGARLFEPLGMVFGQVRVVPDFSAQPYSWFEGDDQFQYIRLHAGINCQSVSEVKIGETAIGSYQDVLVKQTGFPGGPTQLLDWSAVDTIAGGLLDAPGSPGAWVLRTTSVGTVRIAVDIGAQLYALGDDGGATNATMTFEAERRLLPGGSFVPLLDSGVTINLSSHATKPLRSTFSVDVPEGQYEVRMRKTTENVSSSRASNVLEWVSLKSYQLDPNTYIDQPQVGIRIKASGQLNGTLDQVNWLATGAPADLWDGTAWGEVTTSNPGAHLLRFMRGIRDSDGRLMAGMGKTDGQIDLESIKAFMVHCAAMGYRFDHWFDRAASCGEVLEAMASAGLGSISYHTGRIGVVWAAADQPVEAVIAPVRMKPGSFRVEYATRELADELEVTWPERANSWLSASARVKAPGVTIPRDTARLSPVGVTTQAGGLLAARWTMAQNIWQRRAVTWEMDLEHIAFHRFSMVALSHDVTQWGHSGRLHSAGNVAGVVTLTLDMEVPFNPTATARHIALHLPGEQGYRVFGVAAFSGETHTLTLSGTWPSGVPLPGDSADNPAHDTVWLYDFAAQPGKRLRVVSVEPTGNLSGARITAVPEPDEFWAYVAGGAYEPGAALAVTQAVVASNLRVSQLRADVNYDNTTDLAITFDATGPYDHAQVWGARSGDALVLLGQTRTTLFPSWRVPNDGAFAIEVRPFDGLGRPGAVLSDVYTVGLAAPLSPALEVQYSVDGATSWHSTFASGDCFMRQRVGTAGVWSAAIRIVGTNGTNGVDGVAGVDGADGQTSYFHVKYSNDGGSTFTASAGETPGAYIGTYTDFTAADSTSPGAYTWVLIKGADGTNGTNGTPGTPGADGQTSYLHIKWSNDGGSTFTASSGETPGAYIGTYTDFTAADSSSPGAYAWALVKGADGTNGMPGTPGADGQTSYLHIKWSNDGGSTFTASSGETPGAYIGTYTDFTAADSSSPGAYAWALVKGADGTNGTPGTPGADGQTSYLHIKWSNDGGSTFTASSGETPGAYIGTYTDFTAADSSSPGAYAWALVKGADGANGTNGTNGANGTNGTNGTNGAPGPRGATRVSRPVTAASWSDTEAFAALTDSGLSAVNFDEVTLYKTDGTWAQMRYYYGGAWLTVAALIDGNLLVRGSVGADRLNVSSLSAVSAVIGTLRSATSGARLEVTTDVIRVYDSTGALRVKLGNLA